MRLLFICLSLWFSFQAVGTAAVSPLLPSFEAYIQKTLSDWQASGVAVIIVKDGAVVYEKGFGVTDVHHPQPINEHTIFPLASLSKNFLATLMAQLVDEGILNWDAPVRQYLPNFQLSEAQIAAQFTVRDLLTHRSGLKPFAGDTLWNLNFSAQEIQQGLAQLPFVKGFRQEYAYQNHLYGIASELVEKVTGQSITTLFHDRLFKPLDLNDTRVGPLPAPEKGILSFIKKLFKKTDKENVALPHTVIGGKTTSFPVPPMMYTFKGSTGIHTSLHDLGRWIVFQLNAGQGNDKKLISAAQIQQMRTPYIQATNLRPDDIQFPASRIQHVSYGIGWFLHDYGEGTKKVSVLSHMGGVAGVRTLMTIIPEQKLGIAILSNFGAMRVSMIPEALRNKFLDLYLNLPPHDWSQENLAKMALIRAKNKQQKNAFRLQNPRNPHPLKVYVGVYENSLYGRFAIQQDKDNLVLIYRQQRIPLNHWNGDEFEFKGYHLSPAYSDYDQGYIEFAVQGTHAVLSAINLMFEGKSEIFKRLEDKP